MGGADLVTRTPLPAPSLSSTTKGSSTSTSSPLRKEGRTTNQFRKVFLRTGIITQANGSSYIELNKTKVIVGVYGPRHSSKTEFSEVAKITCDFKYATFSTADQQRKKSQATEKEEKEYANLIAQALEVSVLLSKYPKSVIDIYVLVLQSDGGALSAAITAASLALADAGIEMYDLVAASSSSLLTSSSIPSLSSTSSTIVTSVLDPDGEEEKRSRGGVTVALMPSLNETTQLFQTGELGYAETMEAIQLCLDGCAKIYTIMTKHLTEMKQR